ncbi:sulfotransferase domain-containing protein [Fulvivirga lutimaris]|uniref:sulfotransferase domain-containing protein n=1 Tax=Fulvivirga lutimaris TaxID=1819566 RepID=UPI0012BD770B|nr:sulfotransferase domain-containing protein [Fulvivirga lutimaris]MTI37960.1 hypothetical protein [Fulvivirga lutimaris]
MSSDKIFFHLGLPKTGTTTLQYLLRKDDRINYSGKRTLAQFKHWETPFEFKDFSKVNILSEENLLLQMEDLCKPYLLFKRIKNLNPEAEIIITIREQRDLLESRYKYNFHWHGGYNRSFDEWLRSSQGMEYLSNCMYATLYKMISAFFDHHKIHFLLFEELKQNPESYYNRFYNILGLTKPDEKFDTVKKNVALTERELLVLKKMNNVKLFRSNSKWAKYELKLFLKIASFWKADQKKYEAFRWNDSLYSSINEDFREENKDLIAMGLFNENDLAKYGYLLKKDD